MNILIVHNKYKFSGGEEKVVENDFNILKKNGNGVYLYTQDNKKIEHSSFLEKIKIARNIIYSKKTYNEIEQIIKKRNIDIIHIHNIFPLISPSVIYCAKKNNIPVVMTLHNFRLIGGNPFLIRNGEINEESLEKRNPFSEIKYKSYNNSYLATLFLALSLYINRKVFKKNISRYIALTEFGKEKFIKGGFESEKIIVRSSSLSDNIRIKTKRLKKAVYVGRLAKEKGISTLISAWRDIPYLLEVYGEGKTKLEKSKNVIFKGHRPSEEILRAISESSFLILPSEWYENLPNVIIESFSTKTPILSSDSPNLKNLIEKPGAGLTFQMKNAQDLKRKAIWMFNNKKALKKMEGKALKEFKKYYSPEKGYSSLIKVYLSAIKDN